MAASLRRFDDWQERLGQFIRENENRQFSWPSWNCCEMVCLWIYEATGVDAYAPFRGRIHSEFSAAKVMAEYADPDSDKGLVEQMAEHIAREHGIEETTLKTAPYPCTMARRGDVVLADAVCDEGIGPVMGVVDDTGAHGLFITPEGLVRAPVTACRRCWSIG